MSRIHGRHGSLYCSLTSTSTNAEPVAFLSKWSLNATVGKVDVTAFGDTNLIKLAGLPDQNGTFDGWYDNATAQVYTAATDGVARRTYLYPDTTGSQYWFGTAIFDMKINVDVNGGVAISGTFDAASAFSKVG